MALLEQGTEFRERRGLPSPTGLHRLHLKSPRQLRPDAPAPYGVTLKNKKRELLLFLEPPSLTVSHAETAFHGLRNSVTFLA